MSDIIDIGFDTTNKVSYRNLDNLSKADLLPFELASHHYYVRIIVDDKPGVLEKYPLFFQKSNVVLSESCKIALMLIKQRL